MNRESYETGLVLSGGAVRGFAHLGAIKALHEKNISPDVISGSSAGSIVGVFYADGQEPDEIMELFEKKKLFDIYLEPEKLQDYGYFSISEGKDIFKIGYEEAKKILTKKYKKS